MRYLSSKGIIKYLVTFKQLNKPLKYDYLILIDTCYRSLIILCISLYFRQIQNLTSIMYRFLHILHTSIPACKEQSFDPLSQNDDGI